MFGIKWNKKISYKKQEEIFNKLLKKKISVEYFFNRKLINIETKDFFVYKNYFSSAVNFTKSKKLNYRSNRNFKHIHAIVDKEITQIHFDYGNIFKNIFFGIPHFFIDVVPYFLWFLIKWKRPYKIKK